MTRAPLTAALASTLGVIAFLMAALCFVGALAGRAVDGNISGMILFAGVGTLLIWTGRAIRRQARGRGA